MPLTAAPVGAGPRACPPAPAYMREACFALLAAQCTKQRHYAVAAQLGISTTALSLVLRGHGPYGTGAASTARIAQRVLRAFGSYPCPHLTREAEVRQPVLVDAAFCRRTALTAPPTTSPRQMQLWRACRQCPMRPQRTSVPTPPITTKKGAKA